MRIRKPPCSGSENFNYKDYNSYVLLAVANADYQFIWCDIGKLGMHNDGYLFNTSEFCHAVEENRLSIPGPGRLPDSNIVFPHYFVGDAAFGLRPWLFKPLKGDHLTVKQHEFNYRYAKLTYY